MDTTPTPPRNVEPNPLAGHPCTRCGARTLRVELREELVAKPLGTFSLAGVNPKVSAVSRDWPWAVCDTCGGESRGKPA